MYNWQYTDWPRFVYDENIIDELAMKFAELSGRLSGTFDVLEDQLRVDEIINLMIAEALKSSEIEGEMLPREDLLSSIRNNMCLQVPPIAVRNKNARNVASLMMKVRENYNEPLSEKMLKSWHGILFHEAHYINAGEYRKGVNPMQIVSGPLGKETVHYEAPPSSSVLREMEVFINWYIEFPVKGNMKHAILKAGISHLYFESIHPFEDGNGRIGRAIAEKCLAESLGRPVLFSISSAIDKDKKLYYKQLNRASQSLDINEWLIYFAELLIEAQKEGLRMIAHSVYKTKFFDRWSSQLNPRQLKALKKMFGAGPDGFKGGMTTKKYVSITGVSKATATRDLRELVEAGILFPLGEGRAVHYILKSQYSA